jgi:hypothetical protein
VANEPSGDDELMTGTTSKAAAIYGTQKSPGERRKMRLIYNLTNCVRLRWIRIQRQVKDFFFFNSRKKQSTSRPFEGWTSVHWATGSGQMPAVCYSSAASSSRTQSISWFPWKKASEPHSRQVNVIFIGRCRNQWAPSSIERWEDFEFLKIIIWMN